MGKWQLGDRYTLKEELKQLGSQGKLVPANGYYVKGNIIGTSNKNESG